MILFVTNLSRTSLLNKNTIWRLYAAHTVDTVDMIYTVDMTHNEESFKKRLSCSNVSMGLLHVGVQEYFLIDCRTWVSRSIF